MSKLLVPTVHLNGTSGNDLLEQITEARRALRLAVEALHKACPNGRDYYPQSPQSIYEAVEQHAARAKALVGVYNELGDIAQSISDQIV